jgi:hypothetical protein
MHVRSIVGMRRHVVDDDNDYFGWICRKAHSELLQQLDIKLKVVGTRLPRQLYSLIDFFALEVKSSAIFAPK